MQIPRIYRRPTNPIWRIRYYDENNQRSELSTGMKDDKSTLLELARFIKLEEEKRLSVAPFVFECPEYYSERHKTKSPCKEQNDKNIISFLAEYPQIQYPETHAEVL